MCVMDYPLQVETVGDKYMAVSGLPEPCSSHAKCMAGLALDMMDLTEQIKYEDTDVVRPTRNCVTCQFL